MRVIAAQGARRFTARALAREVGISDGAVFRHFPSMEAVVTAVVERMEAVLFADVPPVQPDPVERLGAFFRARVAALAAHPHLARLLFSDQLAQLGGPEQARRIEEFKGRTRRFIAACLAEAKEKGLLAEGLGPREGTVIVQGAVFVLGHGGGVERNTTAVWGALESLLRGVGHRAGDRKGRR
mgnify:FL=1